LVKSERALFILRAAMRLLFIDFETRSECDLPKRGQSPYSNDKTTDVLCMAWSFDGATTGLWLPGQDLDAEVVEHIKAGGEIHAHNAAFEYPSGTTCVLSGWDGRRSASPSGTAQPLWPQVMGSPAP